MTKKIKPGKEYSFKSGGKELAKVLLYYGIIHDVVSSDLKVVCPFHDDINPSMSINLDEGRFYCFGCGVGGNALDFVMMVERGKCQESDKKFSELSSVKKYFKILKSDKFEDINFSKKRMRKKKNNKQSYIEAYDYYYGLKTIDWKNDDEEEVVNAREYMKKRGFSYKALNKCNAKVTYNKRFPIVFPMFDNGEFMGWVCRTFDKKTKKNESYFKKYLYNEGFKRSNTLCGNYNNDEIVIIVEGYMDMLKFIMYGYTNVVAILGWKISEEQLNKLKASGVNKVISALDNDESGNKGTKVLGKHFEVIRWKYLEEVNDPGDMNKKQYKKMLDKTLNRRRK